MKTINTMIKKLSSILLSSLLITSIFTGCIDSIPTDVNHNSNLAYLYVASLDGQTGIDNNSRAAVAGDSTIVSAELTKINITKVVLTSNSSEERFKTLGTWISDSNATEEAGNAIVKMQSDRSVSIHAGQSYTFTIKLYDSEDQLVGSGSTTKNVAVGFNALNFEINLAATGNGNFRIKNCFKTADRVSKIEAGLFDIETEEAVALSETETLDYKELTIVTKANGTDQYAVYSATKIPSGSYVYKIRLYGKDGDEDVVINNYSYVIQIDAGTTTYDDTKILSGINVRYKITYNLNGGNWAEGYSPVVYRNTNTTTILPTAAGVVRTGYSFAGWCANAQLTGGIITSVSTGAENASDKEYWAKWTPNNLSYSVTLHESAVQDFTLTGNVVSDSLYALEAQSGFDTYKWFVDNVHQTEYDNQSAVSLYIQFYDGGHHDITVHVSKDGIDLSNQVNLEVTKLPDFPITYKNGTYGDFTKGDFTGTHESTYAPVFYYGGNTVLDVPTSRYYDFEGYYLSENCDSTEISAISGTDFDDEITLYAKWEPKNALTVKLPENSIKTFEGKSLMTDGSDIYVLAGFGVTMESHPTKWYPFQFFSISQDNLTAEMRADAYGWTPNNFHNGWCFFLPNSAISTYVDNNSNSLTIDLDYTGQKQTVSGSIEHLADYDFMVGHTAATPEIEYVQLGERLNFALTEVPANKTFKKMVLYVPDTFIPSSGTFDMDTDTFNYTYPASEPNYNHFEMELDLSSSNGTLALSTMLPPFNASGKTVIMTLIDSDNNYYNAYFEGQNYVAGEVYNHTAEAGLAPLPHFVSIAGKNIATHNYGAYSPEDYGTLHVYGDPTVSFDAQFGSGAKIPSYADFNALAEADAETVTAESTTLHGVHGVKFTSGSVTLFIPANGYSAADGTGINRNVEVNLWTNTKVGETDFAYTLYGSSEDAGVMAYSDSATYRYGYRPVKE